MKQKENLPIKQYCCKLNFKLVKVSLAWLIVALLTYKNPIDFSSLVDCIKNVCDVMILPLAITDCVYSVSVLIESQCGTYSFPFDFILYLDLFHSNTILPAHSMIQVIHFFSLNSLRYSQQLGTFEFVSICSMIF